MSGFQIILLESIFNLVQEEFTAVNKILTCTIADQIVYLPESYAVTVAAFMAVRCGIQTQSVMPRLSRHDFENFKINSFPHYRSYFLT